MKNMDPVIVSYFTRGTLYEKDAQDLRASCERFGLKYAIEGIDCFGSWDHHCCFKPAYILQKLHELQRPVVWVDADALIVQHPILFQTLDCDLGIRVNFKQGQSGIAWTRAGTLFVNYTAVGLKLMADWVETCQEALNTKSQGSEVWDEVCLRVLLQRGAEPSHGENRHIFSANGIRIAALPNSYCAIFDAQEDQESPVIIHYQASRLYKKFINCEVAPFLEQLSIEHLRDLRPKIMY